MEISIIQKACAFARIAHGDQIRKYTGEPYWYHPCEVSIILTTYAPDIGEDAMAAAYLHDTVEDTKTTLQDIELFFNKKIRQLVSEVTDISTPKDGNRETRKEIDRQHLAKASPTGKSIKLADLIHNTQSITKYDKDFAKIYMKEKQRVLEVLQNGDSTLLGIANNLIMDYYLTPSHLR